MAVSIQAYLDAACAALSPQRPLLDSIRDINMRFLKAVGKAATAETYETAPDLGAAAPLFQSLTPAAIESASRFPFLLLDLGMATAGSLSTLAKRSPGVRDIERPFARPDYQAIARSALVVSWLAARTDNTAALLLFDLSPEIAQELSTLPLHDVEALALPCASPLTLRWRSNASLWQELLNPDAFDSVDVVRGFVMHAVQLTATTHLK